MIKYPKIGLVVLFLVVGGATGYIFLSKVPPADADSDRIAFIAMSSSPGLSALFVRENIYVMNINSPGLTRVVQQPKMEATLAWSQYGDQIAYFDYSSKSLYTINADGSGQPELLNQGIYMLNIDWSPDGTKIVYSDRIGAIRILDLKTKQTVSLLDDSIEGAQPAWAPNGNQIVFTLNPWNSQPASSIALINIDGSDLIQLTPDDQSWSPKWSPDGRQIVFERDRNIYIMNVDGAIVRALTQDGKSYMPSWSPDGIKIAYISTINQECGISVADGPRFCNNELRIMNVDGSNVEVIRNKANERYMSPVWAPLN